MIFNKQRCILNIFVFFFIILATAIWSASILTEWGSDYGSYYTGSYFLSENYRLYQEYFDHKGPLYFFFLQIIGYVIGWGYWQAYLSLFLTVLVFYVPVFCILVSERLKPMTFFAGALLSLCLLYGQSTNASISFFQSGFLLTSFWIIVRNKKSSLRLNLSFFLFVCAILTRIDAVIYFPVYLCALIFNSYPSTVILFIKKLFIWLLILIISYWSLSYKFNFNLNDYLVHNIEFNKWYGDKNFSSSSLFYAFAKSIIRPTSYQLLTSSLIIMPIIILLPQIRSSFYEIVLYLKNIIQKKFIKKSISLNAYSLMIFFLGSTAWFITFSDKNYHLLILLVPLLFFYLINFRFFSMEQSSFIVLTALYCLIINLSLPLYKLSKDPECLYSPFCASSSLNNYAESVNFLTNLPYQEVTVVGGRGWLYFYSKKKPLRSINDWWLYSLDNSFLTPDLKNQHQNLLKMPSGYSFLVDNELLDIHNKNQLLNEVISKSELVKRQFKYSVFKIR